MDPVLTLPHPRMHLRRFVLQPLAELAPRLQVPGLGAVLHLLGSVMDQGVRRLEGAQPVCSPPPFGEPPTQAEQEDRRP